MGKKRQRKTRPAHPERENTCSFTSPNQFVFWRGQDKRRFPPISSEIGRIIKMGISPCAPPLPPLHTYTSVFNFDINRTYTSPQTICGENNASMRAKKSAWWWIFPARWSTRADDNSLKTMGGTRRGGRGHFPRRLSGSSGFRVFDTYRLSFEAGLGECDASDWTFFFDWKWIQTPCNEWLNCVDHRVTQTFLFIAIAYSYLSQQSGHVHECYKTRSRFR